jgi:hypothetical protein
MRTLVILALSGAGDWRGAIPQQQPTCCALGWPPNQHRAGGSRSSHEQAAKREKKLTSCALGCPSISAGRVMVVFDTISPSTPSCRATLAMSALSASVRSGAILTRRGGGPC